ncbi:unnamed protein product [Prorocentrum cordatum]|uniref:Uncharacterized protein n=1 Tax=Prorocentrum cordatum TaxID=2364126 RepID=A0ABN9VJW1_9DINO|nr:unnamed protein product [Polarella glacialis]
MALALRPRHAAAGVVGAVLLRHADLVYQAFLQQAGLWQGAGHAGAEAAAQAAYSAADAAGLAAAAAAAAGEALGQHCPALPDWSGPPEAVVCPEAPACLCSCPEVPECAPEAKDDAATGLWQLTGGAVGHMASERRRAPLREASPPGPPLHGVPRWRGPAVLRLASGHVVEEEAFSNELIPGAYVALPVFVKGRTCRFRDFPDEQQLLDLLSEGRELAVAEGYGGPGPTLYLDAMGERRPLELDGDSFRRARGRPAGGSGEPPMPPPIEPPLQARGFAAGGTRTPEVLDADAESTGDAGRWVALVSHGEVHRGDSMVLDVGDKVVAACWPAYLSQVADARAAGEGGDARVLASDTYDPGGRHWCDFANAVGKMRTEPMDDFPLEGERSALWLFQYVRGHGGTFDARQTKWATEQKIAPDSTAYLFHDLIGLALDLSVSYDQCDGGNLASVEVMARLYQLVEETNGTLQLEGLEHYLGRDRAGGLRRGVALNPALSQHATDKKSKETEVMKQRRKAREEADAAKKAGKGGGKKDKGTPLGRVAEAPGRGAKTKGQLTGAMLPRAKEMGFFPWLVHGRRRLKVQERTAETTRAINRLAGLDTTEVESVSDLAGPFALVYSDARALRAAHAPEPVVGLPTLYGDASLKENRDAYIGFVKDGLARGISRLSRRRKEAVKVFLAKKKDSSIRIVIDCRRSNQRCKAAPKVHLFSGSSLGDVEVSADQQMW